MAHSAEAETDAEAGLSRRQSSEATLVQPEATASPTQEPDAGEDLNHVSGKRLSLIVASLAMSVFLVGLDNAILTTAIPTITTAFDSLKDVGWYGSAFMICL
ncbi:MFS thioclapurine efflux transporter tcpA [Lachnellula suecica]|uniref:MFS thioclapurine efflux transporter tcpA n=1 Tax=Lachnellula suecica TaxID=602035 RepID=A0A8T9CAJ2_9HELO|nr:MFS thioclapurine efflux transporter tcpA [Lachnellula suecica]